MNQVILWQKQVEEAIAGIPLNTSPPDLYDPIQYTLGLGGKRMRPLLVLFGCDLFGGNTREAVNAAVGIELFHNFTLLHDDIMDNAPLRRNKPTVHSRWNTNVAILSGDAMLVKAYQLMMQVNSNHLREVLELFSKTAIEVCEGQQLDMDFEKLESISIADYTRMITLKTSVLLAGSLKTGACIAGASAEDADHIYEFGKNIGIAFQVQDDLLDVYADKEKFGKQVGGDIIAGKKTMLFLKAMETANEDQKIFLTSVYTGKTKLDNGAKVEKVKEVFDALNIPQQVQAVINHFYDEGLRHMQQINVSSEKKAALTGFCDNLMQREH